MKLTRRKIIQFFTYYFIPLAFFLYLLLEIYNENSIYELVVSSGNVAFILILFLVFIKPLSVILPFKFLKVGLSYRREFGVLAFWFAMFHSISLMFYLNVLSPRSWPILFDPMGHILYGLIGFIGMVILGLTSNRFSTVKLGKNWKRIQRVAYPTFVLVALHKFLAEGEILPAIIIIGIYGALKLGEHLTLKKRRLAREKVSSK